MTRDEIQALEEALAVKLPDAYRAALLADQLGDPLDNDLEGLIAINEAFRSGEIGSRDWPATRIAFGHDGGGNYYFLDPSTSGEQVFCRDHETEEVTLEASGFASWLATWLRSEE